MELSWFHKKFSVGLVLDTTLEEYEAFLRDYHPYIANIYFSLPMGDRFHARRRVAEQLTRQESVTLFWQLLELIRRYDIDLEVVFNTGGITPEDVYAGKALLDAHGIRVALVGVVEPLYDAVRQTFPEAQLVYSFNNRGNGTAVIRPVTNRYDEFVVGRQDIRNRKLLELIRQEKQSRTVLLVNNGCSFICGGCTVLQNCHEAYYREVRRRSPAMVYAMQSIMPFELHEGLLPLEQIDRIKLSTRNSDIAYVRRCLESYLWGNEERWLRQGAGNYYLWGRLAWHSEFYSTFDLAQIIGWKRQWYETGHWEQTEPLIGPIPVDLDLRQCQQLQLPEWTGWLDRLAMGFAWKPGICYLAWNDSRGAEKAEALRAAGWQVWLHLPENFRGETPAFRPAGILAEDPETLRWATDRGFPVALGSKLTPMLPDPAPNDYATGNSHRSGDLFAEGFRDTYRQTAAEFAVTTMPSQGISMDPEDPVRLKAYVRPENITACVRKTLVENRVTPILTI